MSNLLYKKLSRNIEPELLSDFLFEYGWNEWQYGSIGSIQQHFSKIISGETVVWAALKNQELVAFTSTCVGPFWSKYQTNGQKHSTATAEIVEFAVHPNYRQQGIGTALLRYVIDNIFNDNIGVEDLYVVHHKDNLPAYKTYLRVGFTHVDTFEDTLRQRFTTVMRYRNTNECKRNSAHQEFSYAF